MPAGDWKRGDRRSNALARPDEVAPHLSIERCQEVMDMLPVLKSSGEYGIVKRQGPSEPPLGTAERGPVPLTTAVGRLAGVPV